MRIAIIGSGIAGLGAAYLLSRAHDVVVYEAEARLGGHTHTHRIDEGHSAVHVDSGFIVFNPDHYPNLVRLFRELDVATQPTTMSFSMKNELSGLEYNATDLSRLFCQRRNLVSPYFWGMVRGILRFYREAPALLDGEGDGPTLGQYLAMHGYSEGFAYDHLIPMASALWSSPSAQVLDFPARYLVQFMANHRMLDAGNRPPWSVVTGGSARYLDRLSPKIRGEFRLASVVRSVARTHAGVAVQTADDLSRFDHVVLACHSDQALALLQQPSVAERDVLGAMTYQRNETVLHTDISLLPKRRAAWAAWNALRFAGGEGACTVSYSMNLLQGLRSQSQYVVTLNATSRIDPGKIIARMNYAHPIYTHASVAAQKRFDEINNVDGISYCGAYWGWGFHEDGLRSGVRVAERLGVPWS